VRVGNGITTPDLIKACFQNAFGVRPSSGAGTAAADFCGNRRGTFIPAGIAVAEDDHTPYFENTPWRITPGRLIQSAVEA
jgi:hypothetical protein